MAHTCRESCGVCGFLSTANSVNVSLFELTVLLIFDRKSKLLEACPIQTTKKITLTVADSNHSQKLMVRKTLGTWTVNP